MLIYACISLTVKQSDKRYTSFDIMVTRYSEIQDSHYDWIIIYLTRKLEVNLYEFKL